MSNEEQARLAALALQKLRNAEFVKQVRDTFYKNPDWINQVSWHEGVRREIDMRLLMKKTFIP